MQKAEQHSKQKTIFITGTDTGAGKTILTALLLAYLRAQGVRAWAMKPFCTGHRDDIRLLNALQANALGLDRINPYHFREPVAPLVAARKHGLRIDLATVLNKIAELKAECETLLVEGIGGLFVPLGENYTVGDLIAALGCPVLVAARNKLGVINQTLLTVNAMQVLGIKDIGVVLMGKKGRGLAAQTNAEILSEWLAPVPVFEVPYMGQNAGLPGAMKNNLKIIQKTLALILGCCSLSTVAAVKTMQRKSLGLKKSSK